MKLSTAEIVDPVPVLGGMINNNTVVGFDAQGRPVITYYKFDARGNTQIFLARRERRTWRIAQLTNWREFRWDFRGRGSLDSRITPCSCGRDHAVCAWSRRNPNPVSMQFARQVDVPAGMQLNAVVDEPTRLAVAWATLLPNRH
jgi:hypothetical protein